MPRLLRRRSRKPAARLETVAACQFRNGGRPPLAGCSDPVSRRTIRKMLMRLPDDVARVRVAGAKHELGDSLWWNRFAPRDRHRPTALLRHLERRSLGGEHFQYDDVLRDL